jgi:hypothetical protein
MAEGLKPYQLPWMESGADHPGSVTKGSPLPLYYRP